MSIHDQNQDQGQTLPTGHLAFGPRLDTRIPSTPTPSIQALRPVALSDLSDMRGVLNDHQIRQRCEQDGLIWPFVAHQVRHHPRHEDPKVYPVISYGLGSSGYDVRLDCHFKIPSNMPSDRLHILDPKHAEHGNFTDVETTQPLIVPPHSLVLGSTLESFRMPRDLMGFALNKSTYVRCGVTTLISPLESGWCGVLTVEIVNLTNLPCVIYPMEGIAQIVFLTLSPCEVSYADRNGKYQGADSVQTSKV